MTLKSALGTFCSDASSVALCIVRVMCYVGRPRCVSEGIRRASGPVTHALIPAQEFERERDAPLDLLRGERDALHRRAGAELLWLRLG